MGPGRGRFSRPPREGTRGTPRPLDRNARERMGSGARVVSSSGAGRRTYRSAFIARSSESERPRAESASDEFLAEAPERSASIGDVQTQFVKEEHPEVQPDAARRNRLAGVTRFTTHHSLRPHRKSHRRRCLPATGPAGRRLALGEREQRRVLRRRALPGSDPLRPRARVNGSGLRGDRSAFLRPASLLAALMPIEREPRARSRATRHLVRAELTPGAPASEGHERRTQS